MDPLLTHRDPESGTETGIDTAAGPTQRTLAEEGLVAEDALATPDRSPILLTAKALAEIAKASAGVNMRTMPQIPDDAPCRFPGSDPNDWFDPLHNLDMIGVAPRFLDEIAASLCEDCPVLGQRPREALA